MMFLNDVYKKEECKKEALEELRKLGVKSRPKKVKQVVKTIKRAGKAVFRVPLSALPTVMVTLKTGQQLNVPKLVHHLCSIILSQVNTEGIFRKDGLKSRLEEMRRILDEGGELNSKDPVVEVAVILKQFLRNLPEPLVPWGYHDVFYECVLLQEHKNVKAMLLACLLLPPEHLNTLAYLMQFFEEVSQYSKKNKMTPKNIAIVVGPNIFPLDDKLSPANVQVKAAKTNEIIRILITSSSSIGIIPESIIDHIGTKIKRSTRKEEKRRSSSLTRMFSGLKKIVGGKSAEEEHRVVTPDLLLTPVSNVTTRKRRTQTNGISNKKKKELLNKLPDNVLLNTPFTPCRTPVSMDLSGPTQGKHLKDSTELVKAKKSQWFSRSKSVKNLKEEKPKTGLERRWSAISQANNAKKKRASDYIRVPKEEYEEIKSRVSAMERRISLELESVQSLITEDSNVKNVQTAYEQTLVQAEHLSPTTDQLAKRLSRELKIRRSAEQKIIRSPSARKIGSVRRKSSDGKKVSRHRSWHASTSLGQGRPKPVQTGPPAGGEASLSGSSDTWVSAEGFFATVRSSDESGSRASLARLRSQNAGMVLAKAKLFDQLKETERIPRAKIGSVRHVEGRMSCRVRSLKQEERRKKSMSPRRRNGALKQMARQYLDSSAEKNKENVAGSCNAAEKKSGPLKDCNRMEKSPKYCTPHIKKPLNVKSPKRLCRTPAGIERSTPLRVLKTPLRSQI